MVAVVSEALDKKEYVNGLHDVVVSVELVVRVVKEAIDVRFPGVLPVNLHELLEDALLVQCEPRTPSRC